MRPSSGWFLADLTWAWSQSRRRASTPSYWPRQWRLRRRLVCRPGDEAKLREIVSTSGNGGQGIRACILTDQDRMAGAMHWDLGHAWVVFRNLQAVWASATMAAPERGGFRLVSNYCAVNKQIKKVPGVISNQKVEMADLRGVTCLGKLDMLQGYWQMPLAAEAQEGFTIATPEGLLTPTPVPQGGLNAMAYFQGVMTEPA